MRAGAAHHGADAGRAVEGGNQRSNQLGHRSKLAGAEAPVKPRAGGSACAQRLLEGAMSQLSPTPLDDVRRIDGPGLRRLAYYGSVYAPEW